MRRIRVCPSCWGRIRTLDISPLAPLVQFVLRVYTSLVTNQMEKMRNVQCTNTTPTTFSYDLNGNLSSFTTKHGANDVSFTLHWDVENRNAYGHYSYFTPSQDENSPFPWDEYVHLCYNNYFDHLGRRVRKTTHIQHEYSAAGMPPPSNECETRTYVYDGWNLIREDIVKHPPHNSSTPSTTSTDFNKEQPA